MVEAALRTVVRDVLRMLAGEGLPAPHHFYITFRTGHPGVEKPHTHVVLWHVSAADEAMVAK